MAKRKSKKRSPHRRRRVSGMGLQGVVLRVAGVGLGALAGSFAVNAVKTAFKDLPAWAAPAGVVAGGVLLPKFMKGNPMVMGIADGMLAIGAVMALNETVLSVPGISGLAMSSNAGPYATVMRAAVGQAPNAFINSTVNGVRRPSGGRAMRMGMLNAD